MVNGNESGHLPFTIYHLPLIKIFPVATVRKLNKQVIKPSKSPLKSCPNSFLRFSLPQTFTAFQIDKREQKKSDNRRDKN
jgi:hypothetical protein